MKANRKSLALAGALAVVSLAWTASPAQAQGFSFGYAGPGVSVGVNTGGFGYGGAVYGGYPVVRLARWWLRRMHRWWFARPFMLAGRFTVRVRSTVRGFMAVVTTAAIGDIRGTGVKATFAADP